MRAEGWEARLHDYLDAARTTPFAWGSHDCALWASGWVAECTGDDHGKTWRGKYKTAKGAKIGMTRRGFKDVAAIADAHLDAKPVRLAQRGDLVLHPSGCLGVCNGLKSHFLTENGLTTFDTLACDAAWTVG